MPAFTRPFEGALTSFGGIAALVRQGSVSRCQTFSRRCRRSGGKHASSVVRAVAEEAPGGGRRALHRRTFAFSRLDDTCAACGLDQVARELGIPIVPFNRPVWVPTRVPHGPARGFRSTAPSWTRTW